MTRKIAEVTCIGQTWTVHDEGTFYRVRREVWADGRKSTETILKAETVAEAIYQIAVQVERAESTARIYYNKDARGNSLR